MAKERIYQLAKELSMPSKALVKLANEQGLKIKSHMSSVTPDQAAQLRKIAKGQSQNKQSQKKQGNKQHQAADKKQGQQHQSANAKAKKQGQTTKHKQQQKGSNNQRQRPADKKKHESRSERRRERRAEKQHNGQNNNGQQSNRNQQKNNHQGNQQNGNGRFGGSLNNGKNKKKNRRQNRRDRRKNRHNNNHRLRQVEHKQPTARKDRPLPDVLEYTDGMNAQDLSKILHRSTAEIVKKLFMLGVMVNQNQALDKDTIEILAADYGIEAKEKVQVDVADIDQFFKESEENTEKQVPRPPVVTVMGHVDHGKTTLLDKIRHSHVTAHEAGGITQAIGAYQVKYNDKMITFLDTPGHAAFTEMRARGANITDITVLVVAADDGVMPQTIEAINHAKAAKTPIIVAVNKIDKPGANPDHVTQQLTEYGLIPEDWGGDTIYVQISAKFGKNIDELLDMILLQAEMMELKANPDQRAAGSVVEARLDQGKGPVATLLIQQGTMHVGDPVVVGNTFGRVRTMNNENGQAIEAATPSTPVEITGLNDVPEAGDRFVVFQDEKTARAAGEERAKRALEEERQRTSHVTLDNLFATMKKGEMKTLPIIIKADVQGSVEALAQSLQKIKVDGVRVDIIHKAVGAISESDVTLAEASNAVIIGFNVRPTPIAQSEAHANNIDIRLHRVIYNAIEEVEDAMKGMLEPVYKEEVLGQVEVRQLYRASKVGTIAGGMVTSGKITRDSQVRLIRDGVVIYEGELGSLKRFKDDVKEVKQGYECGLTIANYNDIKERDVIEAYKMKAVPQK
ncbi:MAG: translation initiation factor IF-2 [[Lactobacillus] timonensis]|jgi:translation initiation factor IF-2|uniref:translation initiation factor IF-2 n=1 Tax=[Lactobacillus] timonensis TaxID=1970790 RepID=UPI000C85769F|nr:translation initiation factor IF-2 [[Lactobacillus] timonensis]MCI1925976.1 translation initiation factor IF-2 [[Lactobacillus] timonensis]MCI1957306.1 translation initiation factor IF-2 [[Lactobacillus] timonensis]MCI1970355.1 translation initiation factor IF-2 [[Lactobacillus] timonensis]MCI2006500.1 translation initiation factor IF-2 [[Lactobacillus] timonensis]